MAAKINFGVLGWGLRRLRRMKTIDTRPFFYPMHVMPPHKNNEGFTVAEEIARKGINLPYAVGLSEEGINRVIQCIGAMT
jgi:perosamine synthetase